MISAQSTQNGGQLFDIYSLKLSSDKVNVEYQQLNENNKAENEFDNLEVLQEKIKNILLVQVFLEKKRKILEFKLFKVEQMKKLQHIKHYNTLSLKDMKNDIKFEKFFVLTYFYYILNI